jgi:CheY-like chemotaxis protein
MGWPAPAGSPNALDKPKLLLIEDDDDSRELLAELLELEFDIVTAEDGEHGLMRFREEATGLVLTDESLPGMPGTAVAREVKALSPDTRVVLVSGFGEVEDSEACDRVLKKPVEPDRLAALLHSLAGA